jgi:hypothetical protein
MERGSAILPLAVADEWPYQSESRYDGPVTDLVADRR